jgi:hypothetical protein
MHLVLHTALCPVALQWSLSPPPPPRSDRWALGVPLLIFPIPYPSWGEEKKKLLSATNLFGGIAFINGAQMRYVMITN